jgi:hypothetical protein
MGASLVFGSCHSANLKAFGEQFGDQRGSNAPGGAGNKDTGFG